MRVLMISTVKFRHNGISSVIMNFYRSMKKDKSMQIDLLIPCGSDDKRLQEFVENGDAYYEIPRAKNLIKYFRSVTDLIRRNKYDLVHVHGNSSTLVVEILAAKKAGVKVRIAHGHNTETDHPHLHRLLQPLLVRLTTTGFACSKDAGDFLFGDPALYTVINNGIEVDKFQFDFQKREEIRNRLSVHPNEKLIGHVGNFLPQKNHEFLIRFAADLIHRDPSYKFLLISDGILHDKIEQTAKQLGIDDNIIYIRKTDRIQDYYQAMDLFILPSRFEGFGVVLVEAQTNGLPCLASDTVTRESNLSGNVKYLTIEDPDVWSKEIAKTLSSKCDREKESLKNAICIKKAGYDIATEAGKVKKIYSDLLEQQEYQKGAQ